MTEDLVARAVLPFTGEREGEPERKTNGELALALHGLAMIFRPGHRHHTLIQEAAHRLERDA